MSNSIIKILKDPSINSPGKLTNRPQTNSCWNPRKCIKAGIALTLIAGSGIVSSVVTALAGERAGSTKNNQRFLEDTRICDITPKPMVLFM